MTNRALARWGEWSRAFEAARNEAGLSADTFRRVRSRRGNLCTPEEQQQILALSPKAKKMIQRHNMAYHTTPEALRSPDYLTIGLHIET